jgi:predicted transposase YbfD/YdcC
MPLTLASIFADLPDPRTETANKRHRLSDILTIATCAVIAGAEGWEDIAAYGRAKEALFRQFLPLDNGIPSHDTFYRVFARLDPDAFADRFTRWVAEVCRDTGLTPPDIDGKIHIAVDGKSARRSQKTTSTGCLHLVEAWAVDNRLILGQRSVPEGSNEIPTFRDLLSTLDLKGSVVTMDAAGCHAETLEVIQERGGDYVVCVKGNQPGLHESIAGVFDRAAESQFAGCDGHMSVGDAHGRHEERSVTVVQDPQGLPAGWPAVGSVALVCRDRQVKGQENTSTVCYYMSSLRVDAAELAGLIRSHWGIESMHWILDVGFREDESRTEAGHAGANLAMMRRVAVSLLRRAGSKGSVHTRRLRAGWDDQYLIQVLQGLSKHSA